MDCNITYTIHTHRVTPEDTPWVVAMERCLEPIFSLNFQAFGCHNMVTVVAYERREKLLGVVQTLAHDAAAAANRAAVKSDAAVHDAPSLMRIQKLRAVLGADDEATALHVSSPKLGERTSGGAVAFIANINIGAALNARLTRAAGDGTAGLKIGGILAQVGRRSEGPADARETRVKSSIRGDKRREEEESQVVADLGQGLGGDDSDSSRHGQRDAVTLPPRLDYCEVHVTVDGLTAHRLRVDTTAALPLKAMSAIIPTYTPRCSKHPAQGGTAKAVAGTVRREWDSNLDTWYLEARVIERVCVEEAFGSHRLDAELECCADGAAPSTLLGEDATCEVFATTTPVEYFHTGNGADRVLPVAHIGEDEHVNSLLDPPPMNISVSLFLETDPEFARAVVTVFRWSSDGEVWEVRGFPGAALVERSRQPQVLTSRALVARYMLP